MPDGSSGSFKVLDKEIGLVEGSGSFLRFDGNYMKGEFKA